MKQLMQPAQATPATRLPCPQPGPLSPLNPSNSFKSFDLCSPCHPCPPRFFCYRKLVDVTPRPECLGHSGKLPNREREVTGGCRWFSEVRKYLFLRHSPLPKLPLFYPIDSYLTHPRSSGVGPLFSRPLWWSIPCPEPGPRAHSLKP